MGKKYVCMRVFRKGHFNTKLSKTNTGKYKISGKPYNKIKSPLSFH